MAEPTSHRSGVFPDLPAWWTTDTVAVVTGANRGIGLEIVRRLALGGMTVVLTARDKGRGKKATADLHAQDLKNVVFHQLDVADPDSVTQFAEWLKESFDGLDVLVNNAGISSYTHAHDRAVEVLNINYHGTVNVTEKFLPLFKESLGGARIINISSSAGLLNNVKDENLRQQLNDPHTFDQPFLNTVAKRYLLASQSSSEDVHHYGFSSYSLSKTLLNAYTRLLAQSYPTFSVNCADPGVVEIDMLQQYIDHVTWEVYQEQLENGLLGKDGPVSIEEGADTAVWLVAQRLPLKKKASSGLFWYKRAILNF